MLDLCIWHHLCPSSKLLNVSFLFINYWCIYFTGLSTLVMLSESNAMPDLDRLNSLIWFSKRWHGGFLEASFFSEANLSKFIGQTILSISLQHKCLSHVQRFLIAPLFFFPLLTHRFWPNSCFAKWLLFQSQHFLQLLYTLDVHRQKAFMVVQLQKMHCFFLLLSFLYGPFPHHGAWNTK